MTWRVLRTLSANLIPLCMMIACLGFFFFFFGAFSKNFWVPASIVRYSFVRIIFCFSICAQLCGCADWQLLSINIIPIDTFLAVVKRLQRNKARLTLVVVVRECVRERR